MPALHDWSRHADEIEEARGMANRPLILAALEWVAQHPRDDATGEFVEALDALLSSRGHAGGTNTNRALEIVLDAYLTQRHQQPGGSHDTPRTAPGDARGHAA